MDPNACLQNIIDLMEDLDSDNEDECREAWENLCEWLRNGGFEPDWAAHGVTKKQFFNIF